MTSIGLKIYGRTTSRKEERMIPERKGKAMLSNRSTDANIPRFNL